MCLIVNIYPKKAHLCPLHKHNEHFQEMPEYVCTYPMGISINKANSCIWLSIAFECYFG